MKIDEKFDYIICGGGATGLLLSHSLISDSFFNKKSVLIIEKESKMSKSQWAGRIDSNNWVIFD